MAASPGTPVPILFVHYGTDWIRGSERCLLDLLEHLDRGRYQPFAWCNAPTMAKALRALDIPVAESRFPILLDWARPRFDLGGFAALVREGSALVRRHRIRLVHANSGAPNQWMNVVARRERLPLLAHLHANYNLRGRCIFGLHHVTLAVGVSQVTVQGLLEDGMSPERVRVIYNGIDLRRLARGDARDLRGSLGIGQDEIVLTSVGSLIPRKGFDVLLRAFARIRREPTPARLLLIGNGPERGALEALARELGVEGSVHFLGERTEVGAIYRDATDLSILASREEALALSLMEALAFGVPVIATRVGGMSEALDDEVTGFLVPPEDPAALADATLRLVRDAALRRRFGEAARARAERDFRVERSVEKLCASYDELLTRPGDTLGWSAQRGPLAPWARLLGGAFRRRLLPFDRASDDR